MSSADPSLSLPHQSHTVPPAHPVPPSSHPTFPFSPVLYPHSPFSASIVPPLAERTRRVIPQSSPCILPHRVIPLASLLVPLSLSFSRRGRRSSAVPSLAGRPQLTLIYVIFSGRPHVTALQRTLNQACPPGRGIRGDAVRGCNGAGKGARGRGRMRTKEAEASRDRKSVV